MGEARRTIRDFSPSARRFIVSAQGFSFVRSFVAKYALPESAVRTLNEMSEEVIYGARELKDLPAFFQQEFGMSRDVVVAAVAEFACVRFLPLDHWIVGVSKSLTGWGVAQTVIDQVEVFAPEVEEVDIDVELPVMKQDIPVVEPVSKEIKQLTPEQFGALFVQDLEISTLDAVLRHRLELAIVSYIKNIRDRLETTQLLKRQVKVGGLGLDESVAGQLLDAVDNLQKEKEIIFADSKEQKSSEVKKVESETLESNALTNEVKAFREDEPVSPMEFPIGFLQGTPAEQVPAGLETVVEPSEKSFVHPQIRDSSSASPPLNDGMVMIPSVIQSGAKDLAEKNSSERTRDSSSALPPLNDGQGAGGVVVHDEIATEVAQIAQAKKEIVVVPSGNTEAADIAKSILFHARVTLSDVEANKRFVAAVDARLRDVRGAFETRAVLEAPLDRNGVGITGMALADVMEGLEAAVTVRQRAAAVRIAQERDLQRQQKQAEEKGAAAHEQREASVMNKRYAEITGQTPLEHVEPVSSPGTRASVAVPAADQLAARDQQIDTHKVLQAIRETKPVATPPPVTPVLSAASLPPAEGRPKVQDIRFERKLAGPLEELRQLGLVDFRRLSKDPVQAATKIHDLVNLLSDQGYDRKIAAIQAWRECPVSQQYVHLSQEALLTGKSVYDILRDRHTKGEDTFTEAELRVVIDLNTTLRF